MLRIETLVYSLLVTGFISLQVSAQTTPAPAAVPAPAPAPAAPPTDAATRFHSEAYERLRCEEGQNREQCLKHERALGMVASTTSDSEQSCDNAKKEFNTAKSSFGGACSSLKLPSGGAPGAIACSWSKERCNCLTEAFDEEEKERYRCDEVKANRTRDRKNSSLSQLGLIDLKDAKRRMEFCPHEQTNDTERYETQLKAAQDRVKELKKQLPQILDKGSKAEEEFTKAQNDAKSKSTELKANFAQQMNEIKRRKEGEEQQAVAKMAQLRTNIDGIDSQIRGLEMGKVEAESKLSQAKMDIELQCHANASERVQREQAANLAKINSNTSMGDFHSQMKKVGVSSRDAWEKLAQTYYNYCIVSRPTREMKEKAQQLYQSEVNKIDAAISQQMKLRYRTEEELAMILPKNGCAPGVATGPMSGESETCASLRRASEEMQTAQQNAYSQQEDIQAEAEAAQAKLDKTNQTLNMEYAEAQMELNDEIKRVENLRAYLDLKRQYGSGGSTTTEAAKELASSSSKLKTAATEYSFCCAERNETTGLCKEVNDFIVSWGGEPGAIGHPELVSPDPASSGVTDRQPTATTPASVPAATPAPAPASGAVRDSDRRLDDR